MQFKTAPVGENGKTVIKQSCIYFFRDCEENPGSFFFINRCAKKTEDQTGLKIKKYKVPNNKEKLSLLNGLVREMNQ